MAELKTIINKEFANPSPDLVKFFSKQVYDGIITPKVLEQFTGLVKRSLANHINDVISERLNIAIKTSEATVKEEVASENISADDSVSEPRCVTTTEELEGFYLIKSILRNSIASERITYRDALTYFAVFIDDNNRKPICRLYFNSANKQIAIIDENKKEIKYKISSLDELYNYTDDLIKVTERFL